MDQRYRNVEKLLQHLEPNSLAHQLCSCFLKSPPDSELRAKVADVLRVHRGLVERQLETPAGKKR